jgi:hypothetical protein
MGTMNSFPTIDLKNFMGYKPPFYIRILLIYSLFLFSVTSTLVDYPDKTMCIRCNKYIKTHRGTEIQSSSIYQIPAIRENIVKKWEDIYIKIILV